MKKQKITKVFRNNQAGRIIRNWHLHYMGSINIFILNYRQIPLISYLYIEIKQIQNIKALRTMIGRAEQYNSILRKILQAGTDVYFGVMFERPNNVITLYRQHIYSLFLLLFFCGEQKHKQYIINRLQLCIEEQKKQIKISENIEKDETSKQCPSIESGSPKQKDSFFSKANKIIEAQIKCLEIVKKQVLKFDPGLNYEFNMHSSGERQILKKGFVMMLTMEKKNFFLKDVSFFDICKTAAEIIGISCGIKNYLDFYIVQFYCSQFSKKNLLVYIQINKQLQTYKYIKQKDFLDADLIINQTSNLLQSSFRNNQIKNISLENSSFFYLLREETSFINSEQNIRHRNSMDNEIGGQEAESRQIQQSAVYEESGVVEQSIVLEQSKVIEQSMVLENISEAHLGIASMQKKKKSEDSSYCNESFVQQFKMPQCQQQKKKQKKWQTIPICQEQIQKEDNSQNYQSENCSIKVSLVRKDKQSVSQNTQACGISTIYQSRQINSKSLVVPAFKRERQRKSSDTIHQNILFSEQDCSFQSFVESMNQDHTMYASNENCYNNEAEINTMLESKTTPFIEGENNQTKSNLSLKLKKQPGVSSIQQLVKMVKSGQTKFDSSLLTKFSFVQMVEALDYLETEQQFIEFEQEKQRQQITEQSKKIDIVSILTAILRQQNYGRISDFIENARKALNTMSVNAESVIFDQKDQLDIQNIQKLEQRSKDAQKSPQNLQKLVKRGQQTLKFPFVFGNDKKQKRKEEICQIMLSGKFFNQSGSPIKDFKLQQIGLSKSRILQISNFQNEEGLNLKCSKIFSPERKLQ